RRPARGRWGSRAPSPRRAYGNRGVRSCVRARMKITVIGRGNVGGGLAKLWRAAGHDVTELGRDGGDASDADVLLVAVPSDSIVDALHRVSGIAGKAANDGT